MFTAKVKRVSPVISTERLTSVKKIMQGGACFKCSNIPSMWYQK